MSKDTPGPREWTCDFQYKNGVPVNILVAQGSEIDEYKIVRVIEKTPLIAAAADLLEACKMALQTVGDAVEENPSRPTAEALIAAIKKAEGKT